MKHRKATLVLTVLALLTPLVVWGAAALTDGSMFVNESSGNMRPGFIEAQLFRCDNSGSLTATPVPADGVTCESGDWSKAVDARGYSQVTINMYEYGTGSADVKLWNCINPLGSTNYNPRGGDISGVDVPGIEDPSGLPTASDPDPMCFDLTNATTVDGSTTSVTFTDQGLSYLVGEINTCTGNCDLTYTILVNK